ncbi:uncharacterized protein LOC135214008 [Macrobrachium nipponense]|uniref:uncharacterized protein LOC135214008 n=1 Tax=Macrobrachium nipponense TaxID=159736 RepID=UPI0030C822EB
MAPPSKTRPREQLRIFLTAILFVSVGFLSRSGSAEVIDFDIPDIVDYGICPMPRSGVVDMEWFSGTWYQVEEVPNQYVAVKKCIRTKYDYNGSALLVTTEGLDKHGELTDKRAVLSAVEPRRKSQERYLQLTAQNVPTVPYHILKANYTEYACVYSCFEVIELKVEVYSILTRTPYPPEDSLEACRGAFQKMRLSLKKLRKVQQGGKCWYAKDLRPGGGGQNGVVIPFPAIVPGIQQQANGKGNGSLTNSNGKHSDPGGDSLLEESGNELISVLEEAGREEDGGLQGYKKILVGNDTIVQLNIKKLSPLNGDNGHKANGGDGNTRPKDKAPHDDASECSEHCQDNASSSSRYRVELKTLITTITMTFGAISLCRAV